MTQQEITDRLATEGAYVYPASFRDAGGGRLFVARREGRKYLGAEGFGLPGEPDVVLAGIPLRCFTWEVYEALRRLIALGPSPCARPASFGTGDRLGLVSAAHLKALCHSPLFPVIAQQSPRELSLTHRSFKSVLCDAALGVLESGYTGAWGADADHIKSESDLTAAVDAGYTMYTLDLSDWTRSPSDGEDISRASETLSSLSRQIIAQWAGKTISEGPLNAHFTEEDLTESAAVYEKALEGALRYNSILSASLKSFDLEISIDEGARLTTPADHLYVVEFLKRSGARLFSIAPRFPGEFQKGIDYVGDLAELKRAFDTHASIARALGDHRLSLHSGSDKFSVYGLFAEATRGYFHVKTSGTSWLEAVGVVALSDRALFQKLYHASLDKLNDNKKLYHIFITADDFPSVVPGDIPAFFRENNTRQLFHVSYGALLDAYPDEIRGALHAAEDAHYKAVSGHITRHLECLAA